VSDASDSERLRELLLDMERANKREREQRQEADALLEGLRALTVGPDEEPRYDELLLAIQPLLEFAHAIIFTLDGDGEMVATYVTSPDFAAMRWPDGALLRRAQRGEPISLFDIARAPEWSAQPEALRATITSALHVALGAGADAAMLLCVHPARGHFTQRHVQLARKLALLASQAVSQGGLRRRIRQRERIFALSHDLLAVLSPSGRFIQANPAWRDTLGKGQEQLGALPHASNLLVQQDAVALRAAMESLRQDQSEDTIELDVRTQGEGGALIWLRWSITFEREEGIFLVSAHDISDLREAEHISKLNQALARARDEAIEASTAKSLFLANISHELRTPLNAVLGYAELLEEELEEQPQALEDVAKIRDAGRHLLSLISNLFDLSRIELGRMEVTNSPLEIEPLITEILTLLKPAAQSSGTTVSWEQETPMGELLIDLDKLRQIVVNLLSNAVRHAPGGVVTLRTGLRVDGEHAELYLHVQDTGAGMSEEQLARLFDPFSQSDSSIRQREGNTGIGLSLSRRFCQMLGGDMRVRSAQGQGTTFTVILPARRRALLP
jgi:PAS domain S-box-containing protein